MSISERLMAYNHKSGPCYCGKRKGHIGWLVCVFGDEPPAESLQEAQEDVQEAMGVLFDPKAPHRGQDDPQ